MRPWKFTQERGDAKGRGAGWFRAVFLDLIHMCVCVVHALEQGKLQLQGIWCSLWIARAGLAPTQVSLCQWPRRRLYLWTLACRLMRWRRREDPLAGLKGQGEKEFYLQTLQIGPG